MRPFEIILLLLGVAVGLGLLARWLGVAYPILLVVGGLLLSLQPGAPAYPLDPDVVLFVFLPPLLYAAAFRTPWPAFRANLRAISLLAVGLVLFTMTVVAVVAHEVVGLPWAAAVVLGAIVSPPDAVAAVSVTQTVRVPRVVATVLEGESLVNDATALVLYRLGVAWVLGGAMSAGPAVGSFVLVAAGGIAVGLAGAWLTVRFHGWLERRRLADSKLSILITLLTPYAIYFPAEYLHVSGVLAVVVAGLWVGNRCERVFSRELYREAQSVWEMVEFLLNSLIFILIGLQLPVILEQIHDGDSPAVLTRYAAAVSLAVIAARLVWVFPGAYLPRWLDRKLLGTGDPYPPWQGVVVVGWAGMRGVVSLAAALALPLATDAGTPFPHRGMIQFLTFWVIFATLVGQGLTLPLVIRVLGVSKLADAERAADPPASC